MKKIFCRASVDAMKGYTPGEQPKDSGIIKLNTNENPFPPSPAVEAALKSFDFSRLRLYSDPLSSALRAEIAARFGLKIENVIAGNGSDDILTMAARCFAGEADKIAYITPSYSLYPVLAEIQGAAGVPVPLSKDFSLSEDTEKRAAGAKILFMARPNAPTGNNFPKERVERICRNFDGVVFIDEAYADFADDNCADFVLKYKNVMVGRTFSKSFSLAGLRVGYALADAALIEAMMKVKDSYNLGMLPQALGLAAFKDTRCLAETVEKVKANREFLSASLRAMSFTVIPSQTNFVFASPPGGDAAGLFENLRSNKIFVRYFPGAVTGAFMRITVGTRGQLEKFLEVAAAWLEKAKQGVAR
jgi:histidinol-phosphate aminotransferase